MKNRISHIEYLGSPAPGFSSFRILGPGGPYHYLGELWIKTHDRKALIQTADDHEKAGDLADRFATIPELTN